MSVTVNSYSVTDGLLIIDSSVASPANYKIHTFYVLCNGHYADEVVPFWDRVSPAYQQVMTTANRRSYIDLSIFPNGSQTFSVRCKHAKTISPVGSIIEDTPVDVVVENTSFRTLLTPLATSYPMGVVQRPIITDFTVPASVESATIPVSITAEDNVAVAAYMVNESATPPLAGAAGWTASAPTSYAVGTSGTKTLYAWAKDADGNVSEPVSATVVVTLPIPPAITFSAQPAATVGADGSVIIQYGTYDPLADDAATSAVGVATVTDHQTFREAAAAVITAGVSVADARRMVEAITSTAQVTATVTDTVRQVEQLLAQIQAFPTVSDILDLATQVQGPAFVFTAQPTLSMTTGDGGIITYGTADTGADDVTATAGATAQVTDTVRRVEAALAVINAIPTVADVVAQVEAVTATAQAQADATDVKLSGIADNLTTAADALAQVSDVQLMVDNVTIMAQAGAGLTEILTYVQTVATTITAGASVVDVLRSAVVIRYLLANICAPRRFADTAVPRSFADLCSIRR